MKLSGLIQIGTYTKGLFKKRLVDTLNKKLQGGALYIAILVSILIGLMLSFFMLAAKYNQRSVTVFAQASQLRYNLRSGFQLAQSAYFDAEQNNRWIRNAVNDDSVRVKKISWGAYLLVTVETKNRHQYLSQSGIYGTVMNPDTGLMISDNSRPVGLSGSVRFKANCYLPRGGVKPAYIEGQSYAGDAGNSAFIKPSPYEIPKIRQEVLNGLEDQLSGNTETDSVVTLLPERYRQAFRNRTLVCEAAGEELRRLDLSGNIKLVLGNAVVDSSAHLSDILIVCKSVRFKKGFKGKVHVIATDSISMEEDCRFLYPSSFTLLAGESAANGFRYIRFNQGCSFYGGVVAIAKDPSPASSKNVFVKLHSGSEVNGFVYSEDYIHLEGILNATVIANKLLLKTPSAVYENHMLGCVINPGKHAKLLAVPFLFKQQSPFVCCEKVI